MAGKIDRAVLECELQSAALKLINEYEDKEEGAEACRKLIFKVIEDVIISDNLRLCSRCYSPVGYNSYFKGYYCTNCGWMSNVD